MIENKDRKKYMLCTPIHILYLSIIKKSKMVYTLKDDGLTIVVLIKTWRIMCNFQVKPHARIMKIV